MHFGADLISESVIVLLLFFLYFSRFMEYTCIIHSPRGVKCCQIKSSTSDFGASEQDSMTNTAQIIMKLCTDVLVSQKMGTYTYTLLRATY